MKDKSNFEKFTGIYCSGLFIPNSSMLTSLCILFDQVYLVDNLEYVLSFAKKYRITLHDKKLKDKCDHMVLKPITDSDELCMKDDPLEGLGEKQKETIRVYLMQAQHFFIRNHELLGDVIKSDMLPDNEPFEVELIKKGNVGELNTYAVREKELQVSLDGLQQMNNLIDQGAFPIVGKYHIDLNENHKEVFCSKIGGDDTYRILPYLMKDEDFIKEVQKNPKLFTGFSDTTINHLMFHKLGLSTYYGPNFICDLAEISDEMLPYSKKAFESYIEGNEYREITSSEIWYQERTDFSKEAVGTERISHREEHGFELLQGKECFEGRLLGGCLESLYDILTTTRYEDEKAVCEKYGLFPDIEEWKGKILFIETCEEKPVPEQFEKEIAILKEKGVFDVVSGVLVGKPQDEAYYDEYKNILVKVVNNPDLPIVYNVNFGHATPRCTLQYGAMARVDMKRKIIKCEVM